MDRISSSPKSVRPGAIRLGRFILRGGGPLYELPLIDVGKKRTRLVFSREIAPAVGEIFEIVRPISSRRDYTRRPESPRKVVALVKVIGIDGDPGALVHVLRGSVTKGYWAERVEEDRIAALLYRSLNVLGFFSIVFHDLA